MYLSLVTGLEHAVSLMQLPLHIPGEAGFSVVAPCLQVPDTAVMGSPGPIFRASGPKAQLKELVLVVPLISKIWLFVGSPFWILPLSILLPLGNNV